ncbi:unnamed protein product [Urochloa humidicola]
MNQALCCCWRRPLGKEAGGRSSSCNEQSYQAHGELLLMKNHFIEVCGLTFSATFVRPLIKAAAFMSPMSLLIRCLLILILAMALAVGKVLMSS